MKLLSTALLLCVALLHQSAPLKGSPLQHLLPTANFLRDLTFSTLDGLSSGLRSTIRQVDSTLSFSDTLTSVISSPEDSKPDLDANRNVSEIIRSRGFQAEEYDVVTGDGYILTIQRIVNPQVKAEFKRRLKPVILQHGLMSSSVDWVINSLDVHPEPYPKDAVRSSPGVDNDDDVSENIATTTTTTTQHDSQIHPNSLGFYLANEGYDVFLANSRGNIYGQRHLNLSNWQPKFWDFNFDHQIAYDLPDTIRFVQRLTNKTKLGYVGHSQGTAMMFGLLSERPEMADIVVPYIALAPVAYVSNSISPAKYFAVYTPVAQHLNMWFGTSNLAVRYLAPIVCGPQWVRREICANIVFLSTGFNEEELDQTRMKAYLAHMPSGTSVKNIAHYGQEVISGRFAKFDHGLLGNQATYGQTKPPSYDLSKIRSRSMALFFAENDWLASPKDVAHLRADLRVEPFRLVNMTEVKPKWNHIDFVYAKHAGELVNTQILDIFRHFD